MTAMTRPRIHWLDRVLGSLFLALLVLLVLLLTASPATAHGPVAPQEVEAIAGRILIKTRQGVELLGPAGGLVPYSQELASLYAAAGVVDAEALFPHYRPAAIAELEHRTLLGLVAPPSEVRRQMAGLGRWLLLRTDPAADIAALARQYAALPEIEAAEPDYLMRLVGPPAPHERWEAAAARDDSAALFAPEFLPDDPDFGLQWGLDFIDAPEAWDLSTGSAAQVIAVIDTGIDLDHPDLASKIWTNADEQPGDANGDGCPGLCGTDDDGDGLIDEDGEGRQPGDPDYDPAFADDDDENGYIDDFVGWDWIGAGQGFPDNDPQDDNGHGTHCAGIAAAATDNAIGGAGACPDCLVMPLKAFQSSGTGAFSDIAQAIDYAYRNGATVLSMSFSSPADSSLVRDALSLAFSSASLVAAAGNNGLSRLNPFPLGCSLIVRPYYPAHYSFVLGVEAGDGAGARADFSNCEYELRNPGEGIYSTVLDDAYATWSGTSMAAPFVAGTAGLLRAFHAGDPAWTPDLIFGQLIQTGGNAFDALTLIPEPDLRFISFEIVDDACGSCDGDGVADSGETVDLAVTVRNLWGDATAVTGTLATADPLATVVDGSADWGAIGPAAFDDNADNPFVVDISPATGNNRDIVFDLVVDAANGGSGITTQIVLTVQRGVERSGILSSSETWTQDNLYLVTGNLLVDTGATLTIEAGTRVQIDADASISVRGELVARGTSADRIVFTGNPEGWDSIILESGCVPTTLDVDGTYLSGSIVEHCVVERADGDIMTQQPAISLEEEVVVRNCIFRNLNNYGGILLGPGGSAATGNLFSGNSFLRESGAARTHDGVLFEHNTVVGNTSQWTPAGAIRTRGGSFLGNNVFSNLPYDLRHLWASDMSAPGIYWGTTDPGQISAAIYDFFDNPTIGVVYFDPPAAVPDPLAPPVVADITLTPPSPVGAQRVTFTVSFSKPMDTTTFPEVFFGPAPPFTSHPVDLNPTWLDPQTFEVEADITVFTGDGLQTVTVWNAKDLEEFPIPTRDHRFGFEIVTSGTSAAQLNATGAAGHIDLDWFPSDLPDVAGYNLYRGDQSGGPYARLNAAVVVDTFYEDHTVLPGVTYFYVYRVVTTDLLEGPDSDEASAAALDTVAPVIDHTPVTTAPAGQPLTLVATITDNIAVTGASAFHRPLGSGDPYAELAMINATGDQYTVNIPAGDMVAPGIEYYLEASDGVNTTEHGSAATPHEVTVEDVPVVLTVTPDAGSFLGGEVVTITGSNFVDPPLVRFGGEASPLVTFLGDTELEATTPPHYPALVDVEVENPGGAVGRATHAFIFVGNTATLTLPAAATGDRLTTVQLAINTPSVEGLLSALLTVQFDAAVLDATGASTGNLTTGFSLAANTSVPGEITVSMANATPVTGAGDLALLEFQVIGSPDGMTALQWLTADLNDGAIPATLVDGTFTVNNSFDVTGTVAYYQGALPVPGTQLDLTGSGSFSTSSDAAGAYGFLGLPSGSYTLTPSKADGHSPAVIGPFDASLVLQHAAGTLTLTGHSAVAADVNKAGGISPFDAALILQYAVGLLGLPFPGSPEVWDFDPSLYSYTDLDLDQPNQDFTGILVGDPSGNWTPGAAAAPRAPANTATLSFGSYVADPATAVTLPLAIADADGVLAVLATIQFDPAVLLATGVSTTSYTGGFSLVANLSTPGQIVLGMASAVPLAGSGDLVTIGFDVVGPPGSATVLDLVSAELNEGAIGAVLVDGSFTVDNAFDVSGAVSYYAGASPVAGAQLDVTGSGSYTTSSDATGAYAFLGLPNGGYTLTPSKSDDAAPSVINPYDASLALQHAAGSITLTGHAAAAADVNKAGGITAFDASLILQYAVGLIGLPFPGNPAVWEFDPAHYDYPDLVSDQTGQDFLAILDGDPSGNWPAGLLEGMRPAGSESTATLRFDDHTADPGATLTVPLVIDDADGVLAVLATVRFDPHVLAVTAVTTTAYTADFALETNLATPGEIAVAMAAATPLAGSGELLEITFEVVGNEGSVSPLDLLAADLNEGAIAALLVDGLFQTTGDPVFFADGFESGDTSAWSAAVP